MTTNLYRGWNSYSGFPYTEIIQGFFKCSIFAGQKQKKNEKNRTLIWYPCLLGRTLSEIFWYLWWNMACRRHQFTGSSRTVGHIPSTAGCLRKHRRTRPAHTLSEINRFQLEGTDVLIKHIGGYPGKYDPSIRKHSWHSLPKLFISGHSHILKVKYDSSLGLLHQPGSGREYGFHRVRTLVRFSIENGNFSDLEVIELND